MPRLTLRREEQTHAKYHSSGGCLCGFCLESRGPLHRRCHGHAVCRLLDLVVPPDLARTQIQRQTKALTDTRGTGWFAHAFPGVAFAQSSLVTPSSISALTVGALRVLPLLLVCVGIAASFVLGANDVSNATRVFILTHLFSLTLAGLIGGLAMAT
jgi:hypothetical protein